MPQFRLWKNLLEAIDAAARAGGTDPHLSPRLDASNAAKRKFRFLPKLGFRVWVHAMPCQRTLCCCSVCFSRSVYTGGKMLLPIDSFQINVDYHKMPSSWNVLFSVCQSLPPSPAGVWAMTEEYALRIWNEVSPVVKPLCYSAVTFTLELFAFILHPSISFSAHQAWIAPALLRCPWFDGRGPE